MNFFHVIYTSNATSPFSSARLRDLLTVSRERNYKLRLTGLLLFSRGRFMQVLEGSESAVNLVFSSIQRDNRHRDLHILVLEQKERRHFPDWRMGFRNFTVSAETLPTISKFLEPGFDTSIFRDDSSDAYRLLLEFRSAQDA